MAHGPYCTTIPDHIRAIFYAARDSVRETPEEFAKRIRLAEPGQLLLCERGTALVTTAKRVATLIRCANGEMPAPGRKRLRLTTAQEDELKAWDTGALGTGIAAAWPACTPEQRALARAALEGRITPVRAVAILATLTTPAPPNKE